MKMETDTDSMCLCRILPQQKDEKRVLCNSHVFLTGDKTVYVTLALTKLVSHDKIVIES